MKILEALIKKIAPEMLKKPLVLQGYTRNYRKLRGILTAVMMIIALGPVFMTAALSYYNYNDLLKKEERGQLEWRLDGSIRSINAMVDSLTSVILFTARDDRFTELVSEDNLEKLYSRLKRQYSFIADIGVIDQQGVQLSYYGPYSLQGTDYSEEDWFRKVMAQGEYISKVYMGYRQVPHFAIAVSNIDPLTRKQWVLRVTINASTLQNFVDTIKTTESDDLFLIDDQGMLQTHSSHFGSALEKSVPSSIYQGRSHLSQEDSITLNAVGKIGNTPWYIVIVNKKYVHQEDWVNFRNRLAFIVFGCIVATILVVYFLVSMLTNLIKVSDELQLGLLKETEHQDRLASIGRLAAGVGHEINNPLAIINQRTGLIEDLLSLSPEFEHKQVIAESLQSVNQSVARCKAVTHRLLGFARPQEVKRTKLRINEILREVCTFLENALTHRRIQVDFQLQDDLPDVVSEHLQLQQVFLNIINNSIDAIGKDGNITIMSHVIAGDVRIVIQDDGPGIEQEILPHIFEPFFTTKETGKGTGLGLSITYGLIKKLGGDITVRSSVNQGTAFTITIPTTSEENDAE